MANDFDHAAAHADAATDAFLQDISNARRDQRGMLVLQYTGRPCYACDDVDCVHEEQVVCEWCDTDPKVIHADDAVRAGPEHYVCAECLDDWEDDAHDRVHKEESDA